MYTFFKNEYIYILPLHNIYLYTKFFFVIQKGCDINDRTKKK